MFQAMLGTYLGPQYLEGRYKWLYGKFQDSLCYMGSCPPKKPQTKPEQVKTPTTGRLSLIVHWYTTCLACSKPSSFSNNTQARMHTCTCPPTPIHTCARALVLDSSPTACNSSPYYLLGRLFHDRQRPFVGSHLRSLWYCCWKDVHVRRPSSGPLAPQDGFLATLTKHTDT